MHTRTGTQRRHLTPLETLALMAVSAVLFVAIPVGAAHANELRPSNTKLDCSTNAISAGATTTCTVTVKDSMVGRSRPGGTVAFTSTPATAITLSGPCTLVPTTNDASACTVDLLYDSPGKQVLSASFTATDGSHSDSESGSKKVTVTTAAAPVMAMSPMATTTITTPTPIDVYAAGCTIGGHAAYWGEFVSQGAGTDPLTSPNGKPFEALANPDGSAEVHWRPADAASNGVWQARWYCSATSPTSVSDPAIHWIGALSTTTIAFPTT